jgi:hypothetical protein
MFAIATAAVFLVGFLALIHVAARGSLCQAPARHPQASSARWRDRRPQA